MAQGFHNILVVGKSSISNAIVHALSHPGDLDHSQDHHHSNGALSRIENHTLFSSPFNLTLLTRPHQVPSNPHALIHVTTTFDLASLTSAFKDQHVVVSTISGGDISFQKLLIDAAIAAGVRRFIPNEFSHNTQNPRVCERFPPCQARAEVLQYLREKSREHKEFSWIGFATGCLIEEGLKGGLLGFDLQWSSAIVYGSGEERFVCSTLKGVGEAVREVLMKGEEVSDGYLYHVGIVTYQNEILAALQTSSGKDWSVGWADVEEAVREAEARMAKGFFDGPMLLLERSVLFGRLEDMEVWQVEKAGGDSHENLPNVVTQVLMELEKNGEMDCGCG